MASVHTDSELMTNYVPALPVKGGSHFVTLLDPASRRPMVVGISTDPVPKLRLVKEDETGTPQLYDWGAMLGIPENTPVQAFDCQQSNDLSVYLCVAVGTADGQRSDILVVRPFQVTANQATLKNRVMPTHSVGKVQEMYMGPPDAQQGYPMVLLTLQPDNRVAPGSDITRLLVDSAMASWTSLRDMELPINAMKILDIAPAANAYGRGLYALCDIGGGQRRIIGEFARYDTDQNDGSLYWFNTEVNTPKGASSIATFTDSRGRSNLLISCDAGLQYLKCSEATSKYAPGITIASTMFQNSKSLRVSQDKDQVTIWSLSGTKALGYSTFTSKSLQQGLKPTPVVLVPWGVESYSASVSVPSLGPVSQTLVTIDSNGNLTILAQSLDSRLWKPQPFFVAAKATNVAFSSYTITMQAFDSNKTTVSNGKLSLSASSQVNALVNGSWMTLTTTPMPYTLDFTGELAIIIGAETVSAQKLQISALSDSKGNDLRLQPTSIDPSLKVIDAMGALTDPEKLRTAKDKNGKSLFEGQATPSSDDLQKAADAVKQMYDISKDVRQDVKRVVESPRDTPSDAWHKVKKLASDAKDWIVKQIDGAWHFVCTIAGETFQFILDTIEKIGEGLSWIWSKLKIAWKKVKDFFGWLFAIDDIINTKNTITVLFNGFLTFGKKNVENLVPKVDQLFDGLKKNLVSAASSDLNTADNSNADSSKGESTTNSTGMKWVTERLKNGKALEGAEVAPSNDPAKDADINSILKNDMKKFVDLLKTLLDDPSQMITSMLTNGAHKAMEVIKTFAISTLIKLCDGLCTAFKSLLRLLAKLIGYFQDMGNYPITIPVFSDLLKTWTGSDGKVTVFESIAFIIAIPMTILTKAITGSPPPNLSKVNPGVLAFLFQYNVKTFFASFDKPEPLKPMPQAQMNNDLMAQQINGPQMKLMAAAPSSEMQSMAITTSENPGYDRLATMGSAVGKLATGIPPEELTREELDALESFKSNVTDLAETSWDDFLGELSYLARIIPTITAGLTAAISFVVAVVAVVDVLKGLTKQTEQLAKLSQTQWYSRTLVLVFTTLGGFLTMVFPHSDVPGVVPRVISGFNALCFGVLGTFFSVAGERNPGETGEDGFRYLQGAYQLVSFGCFCAVYDEEFKAIGTYKSNDTTCSILGVGTIVYTFLGAMSGLAGYKLMQKPATMEYGLAAYGGQALAGIVAGGLMCGRFAVQYDEKFLPSVARV